MGVHAGVPKYPPAVASLDTQEYKKEKVCRVIRYGVSVTVTEYLDIDSSAAASEGD